MRERQLADTESHFIAFSAQTRMSGVDVDGRELRKGAAEAIYKYVKSNSQEVASEVESEVIRISQAGGTPLAVADTNAERLRYLFKRRSQRRHARKIRAAASNGNSNRNDYG